MIESLEQLLKHHPFFSGLPDPFLKIVAGCGKNAQFAKDTMVFREGDPADCFYLIRDGHVALEIHSPKGGTIVIQSVPAGQVLGWSWMFPPYRWHFDARATEPVRATRLDAKCLRDKCEADPKLGFDMMRRFNGILLQRLQSTRLQLIDAYETKSNGARR
jgi:CRP-like cAMP-binding protein